MKVDVPTPNELPLTRTTSGSFSNTFIHNSLGLRSAIRTTTFLFQWFHLFFCSTKGDGVGVKNMVLEGLLLLLLLSSSSRRRQGMQRVLLTYTLDNDDLSLVEAEETDICHDTRSWEVVQPLPCELLLSQSTAKRTETNRKVAMEQGFNDRCTNN
jgi:hypothetical protein